MSGITERPTVLVFATGGTIGMHPTDRGLAADPEFPAALEMLLSTICAPLGADFRVNLHTPPLDSGNADADTAPRFAAAVRSRVRTVRPRGVVVLHGTDTLAYTAARLAFELDGLGVPVVLTGSQLPYGDPNTDAIDNLRLAVRAALRASATAPASIAFAGTLMPAVRATKYQAEDFEAFRAARPLAPGAEGVSAAVPVEGAGRSSARIISFRFVPGVVADDLRAAVGGHPDGLVLECYGRGNAPTARPGMAEALSEVCAAMPVVAITQCGTGSVDLERYAIARKLIECGVIDGGDMTIEAAIAKLGALLDRGVHGAELGELMRRNIVGERSV